MRVALKDDAVLARAWLALIGVAAEINRPSGILRNETPFETGGKTGAAPAPQTRGLCHLDDFGGRQLSYRLARGLVAAQLDVTIDLLHAWVVNVLEKDKFVIRHEGIIRKKLTAETQRTRRTQSCKNPNQLRALRVLGVSAVSSLASVAGSPYSLGLAGLTPASAEETWSRKIR